MPPWTNNRRSEDEETKRSSTTREREGWEDENPFIAFRRFADEQFSTLVQGINALPEMLNDAQRKAERIRSEHDMRQGKWYNAHPPADEMAPFSTPDPLDGVNDESLEAARALLLQARNANEGVNPRKILDLYRDGEGADAMGLRSSGLRWLSTEWFRHSPYSPARLEEHHDLHRDGSKWRAAFEDLLCATLDKEQSAQPAWTGQVNNQKLYATWAQRPVDWMLGLQCRGILPPQLPALYHMRNTKQMDEVYSRIIGKRSGYHTRDIDVVLDVLDLANEIGTFDADERAEQMSRTQTPETEQDLYESFLGNASRSSDGWSSCPALSAPSTEQKPDTVDVSASKILSTLSTTERTTLPDGSSTTKVVLKKRFADGREESTETVSTTHASEQGVVATQAREQREGADEDNKKKGWFWN